MSVLNKEGKDASSDFLSTERTKSDSDNDATFKESHEKFRIA